MTGIVPFVSLPVLDLFAFSLILGFVLTLSQKLLVNQSEAKRIKDRMSSLNQELKKSQDNKGEYSRLFSDYMKENHNLMSMTMKPTLVSLVLFIFIAIPLMEHAYGDQKALLQESVGNVTINGTVYQVEKQDAKILVNGETCDAPCEKTLAGGEWEIRYEQAGSILFIFPTPEQVVFSRIVAHLPIPLPLAGSSVSWLGWYLLSLGAAIPLFRKAMKIVL